MSNYKAIADVGFTLIELLRDNMEEPGFSRESIVLFSPGEIDSNDNVRLSLFLYQVLENVHLKNQEMQVADPKRLTFPSVTLELYYMLTSHPPSGAQERTDKSLEEHTVLGKAVRVLYDNPILKGSVLKGDLNKDEELHVTMTSLNLEDLTKIWTTFSNKPFRPSVCYVATPVRIDSEREIGAQRVVSREINYMHKIAKKGGK